MRMRLVSTEEFVSAIDSLDLSRAREEGVSDNRNILYD
jgi:hypothetical protein